MKKLKPCEVCQTPVDVRYRIQSDRSQAWRLVCPSCWEQLGRDNPWYRYGGTWKART